MAQPLMVDTYACTIATAWSDAVRQEQHSRPHISPASLATLWRAHLVTVIDLSRSHLVLAKIGSVISVELPAQRGHIPWALAA